MSRTDLLHTCTVLADMQVAGRTFLADELHQAGLNDEAVEGVLVYVESLLKLAHAQGRAMMLLDVDDAITENLGPFVPRVDDHDPRAS